MPARFQTFTWQEPYRRNASEHNLGVGEIADDPQMLLPVTEVQLKVLQGDWFNDIADVKEYGGTSAEDSGSKTRTRNFRHCWFP